KARAILPRCHSGFANVGKVVLAAARTPRRPRYCMENLIVSKLFIPNPLSWAFALLLAVVATPVLGQGIDYQLGIGHDTGDSVGLDDGYTRFETWVPLLQPTPETVIFGDLRFLLFNDSSDAVGAN